MVPERRGAKVGAKVGVGAGARAGSARSLRYTCIRRFKARGGVLAGLVTTEQFEVCVEFEGGTEEWLAGTTCIMRFGYGQHKTFLTGLKATHQLERLYAPHVRRADCPQCMANASSSGGNDAGGGGVGGVGDSGGSGGREQSFATTFEMRNAHSILGQDLA